MVPAAAAANLHVMHGEFFAYPRHPGQFRGASRGSRCRTQPISEDPGHHRQLFFSADRAADVGGFAVKLRGAKQVGVSVTYLADSDPSRVDVGEDRPAPERKVDQLPL